MSCQIYGMTTIECTLCEHSIVMNKATKSLLLFVDIWYDGYTI